jgi:hypothetical protein
MTALKSDQGRHLMSGMTENTPAAGKGSMSNIQMESDSGLGNFSLSEILADAELCTEIEKWSAPSFVKAGEIHFRQGDSPSFACFEKSGEIALTMHVSGVFERRKALWLACLPLSEMNPIR